MPLPHILSVDGGSVSGVVATDAAAAAAAALGYLSIPTGIGVGALDVVTASRPPSMSSSVGMGSNGVLKVLVPPPFGVLPPPAFIDMVEGGGGGSGGEAVDVEDVEAGC